MIYLRQCLFLVAGLTIAQVGSTSLMAKTYYISPTGNNRADGLSTNSALATIQQGVDLALAEDTVFLTTGTYLQDMITKRSGTASKPIIITGAVDAVVRGQGEDHVFEINHNYITLQGFTINGRFEDPDSSSGYRGILIYAQGQGTRQGVEGLTLAHLNLRNSAGECVRLRYFAQNNEIAHNHIKNCGIDDFRFDGGGKNGEGIYIGTAPEQRDDGKNPTTDPDQSNNNWVHHNFFDTQGNECVDIKEAATGNIIENNSCTGQQDPDSGGFDSRGSGNTFRFNEVFGNVGAGVRLGGDTSLDGTQNNVYSNNIHDNLGGGIKFQATPQAEICGNTMLNNANKDSTGTYAAQYQPTHACN